MNRPKILILLIHVLPQMPLRWHWYDRPRLQEHHAATPELQDVQEALLEAVLSSAAQWKDQISWGSLEALLYKLYAVGH